MKQARSHAQEPIVRSMLATIKGAARIWLALAVIAVVTWLAVTVLRPM
jgi:hypothetical protein